MGTHTSKSSATVAPAPTPAQVTLRSKLPSDILSLIETYIGPCPHQKARKDAILALFSKGTLGIPHWNIMYSYGGFHYSLTYPNYDYVESMVRGRHPKALKPAAAREYYAVNSTGSDFDIYTKYHISMSEEYRKTTLRDRLFLKEGYEIIVGSEGVHKAPFDLSYDDANNEDLLFIFKYTHYGNVVGSIERRFELMEKIEGKRVYQTRILEYIKRHKN